MTSLDDYKALRDEAGIGTVSPRGQIALTGRERAAYLQGLLTNDIVALTSGSGCYAAWLTPQGRMIADLHVLESGDMTLLDVPAGLVDALAERLDQFLFGEDVQIGPLAGTLTALWVHGPRAAAVIGSVAGSAEDIGSWPEYRNARVTVDGAAVVLARIDQLGVPGFCLYVEPSAAAALTAALVSAGARVVGQEAIEAARVEAGYPVFGVDMSDDTIPLEAGIEPRAISFTKGCYVGQEIVIRILHRGGGRVAKKLVGLRLASSPPQAGEKIWAGGKEIGVVTSAASSPVLGAIALAYVHRDFTAPGSQVEVATADGPRAATVTARPIPTAA